MPKASFATKDAYVPLTGFQEGNGQIIASEITVFQYPPAKDTGEQNPPFVGLKLNIQKLDDSFAPTDDEPQERIIRVNGDLTKMRPGRAASRDDADPEDLGDELDTSGNCIYVEEGEKINVNSGFMVFMRSLEEQGVKPEITGGGYSPDLIGLKGHFKTVKGAKISFRGGQELEPNHFVADKIVPTKATAAAKKPAAKAATAAAGAGAASSSKANGAANGALKAAADPDAIATQIVTALATELAGESRETKKFYAMAYARLVKDKSVPKEMWKPVQELLKSEDWLVEKSTELEFAYDTETLTFAAA